MTQPNPWNLSRSNAGHLVLIGYRASGKTSVGRELAGRLHLPFTDSDDWIVKHSGRTIVEWFEGAGEPAFRDVEETAVEAMISAPPSVLALGGGVVERKANHARIRSAGLVIWLQGSPEVLWQRIQADERSFVSRPALTELGGLTEIRSVLGRRSAWYASVADLHVSTESQSVESIASLIVHEATGI